MKFPWVSLKGTCRVTLKTIKRRETARGPDAAHGVTVHGVDGAPQESPLPWVWSRQGDG